MTEDTQHISHHKPRLIIDGDHSDDEEAQQEGEIEGKGAKVEARLSATMWPGSLGCLAGTEECHGYKNGVESASCS